MAQNPIVTIEMENGGIIKLELYPDIAPESVNNFISLVKNGFYDGLIFHRVISGFMIQGGDPQGTRHGLDRVTASRASPDERGGPRRPTSVACCPWPGLSLPDSAGSQFFIMHEDGPFLDGQYAAFGAVTEGLDTVEPSAAVRTGRNDRPMEEAEDEEGHG